MISSFSWQDRKWIPYQDSEWRPTRSPCLLGSCLAPGSSPGTGHELGPAGPVLLASSLAPGKSPPCTDPSLCCWDLHTSRTQAAPSIWNTSAGLNSSGLKKGRKRVRHLICSYYQCHTGEHPLLLLHFKMIWRTVLAKTYIDTNIHIFFLNYSSVYPPRLFWGELQSFGEVGCREACLHSNIMDEWWETGWHLSYSLIGPSKITFEIFNSNVCFQKSWPSYSR